MRVNVNLPDDDASAMVFVGRTLKHALDDPEGRAWIEFGEPPCYEAYAKRNQSGSYTVTVYKLPIRDAA